MLGGLFLMLSYFGCDQSQVQRYLTAKSVDQARSSLLMSAYWKIPLQALVLGVGVLTFLFYVFHPPPMLFHPVQDDRARRGPQAAAYLALEGEFRSTFDARRLAAEQVAAAREGGDRDATRQAMDAFRQRDAELASVRARAVELVKRTSGEGRYTDVNYVFPTFITTVMPIGLVGLWIVAIITAATDSMRHHRPAADEGHYLLVSKVATAAWGIFACVMAVYASTLGSLIEVVNRFGSFFYGSILGVFALAILARGATGTGAFVGLIAGMSAVAAVAFGRPDISFLWHNVIGAVTVFVVGWIVSALGRGRASATA
jgi:hypothetical protein